jgi:O-antigen/teichoic acid export membrane protein
MKNSEDSIAGNLVKNERQSANWDISNAPKNYLLLVLTQVASAFFAFASVWLITKYLGSEGYGSIIAIIAASQVAQIMVNWTSVAVVRFGAEEFVETEKIARTFWLRLFILFWNFLLVSLVSGFWFPPLSSWLKLPAESFWFVILHFAASAFWLHVQFSLQGAKLPRIQGYLLTIERFLIFAGVAGLFLYNSLSPLSALICYSLAPLLMMLVGIIFLRHFIFARFSINWQFTRKILAYSLPLLPFSLVGYFSTGYFDAIFISKFLSTQDLGIYSVATQINGITFQLPTLANSLLLPLFVTLQKESKNQKTSDYFRHILPGLTLFYGLACTALSFFGYFAVPLIFGAEFQGAVLPLWILLASTTVSVPILIGYSALSNSTSTTYISMFAAIFSAVANIGANLLLIPKYGMAGCAWATVIAYIVSVMTFTLLLKRSAKIPLSWVFIALLPSFISALLFSANQNPWLALSSCFILSFFVGYLHNQSLKQMFRFINNYKKS